MKIRLTLTALILFVALFSKSQGSKISIVTNVKEGLWSDASIWSNNKLPTDSEDVILVHDLIVDVNTSCNSLKTNGYNLVINSGINLKILGDKQTAPYSNSIIYTDTANATAESVMAIFNEADLGYDFHFWGTSQGGQIDKINSVTVTKHGHYDTSMHFVFDDSLRIKKYYLSINGIPDSIIYRFNYQDSEFIMTKLYTNWADTVLLRETTLILQKSDTSYQISSIFNRTNSCATSASKLKNSFKNVLKLTVGLAIATISIATFSPIGLAIGIGAAIHAGSTQGETIDGICETVSNCFISSADASVVESFTSNLIPNPKNQINKITSTDPVWNACACSFSWPALTDVMYTSISIGDYSLPINDVNSKVIVCGGEATTWTGRFFYLDLGKTTSANVTISFNNYCNTGPPFYQSAYFRCD